GDCGDYHWCGNGIYLAIDKVTVITDSNGRWRYDRFPAGSHKLPISVDHPDFVPAAASGLPMGRLRDRTKVIVLDRGVTVRGQVTDQNGEPIAGATVTLGHTFSAKWARQARTDDQGRYTLPHADARRHVLTAT